MSADAAEAAATEANAAALEEEANAAAVEAAEQEKQQNKRAPRDKGGKREVHQPQLSCTNIDEH